MKCYKEYFSSLSLRGHMRWCNSVNPHRLQFIPASGARTENTQDEDNNVYELDWKFLMSVHVTESSCPSNGSFYCRRAIWIRKLL